MIRQLLFYFAFIASSVGWSNWAEQRPRAMTLQDQVISTIWSKVKVSYSQRILDSTRYPQVLYDFQIQTNLVFDFAVTNVGITGANGEKVGWRIVDEIVSLANQAATKLVQRNKFWYPQSAGWVQLPLAKSTMLWVDKNDREVQLASTQYLGYISQILVRLLELREEQLTPAMKEFLRIYPRVLIDHYERWENDTNGVWQVRGWGCKRNGQYVIGRFNFRDLLSQLLSSNLGDNLTYCNAITDYQLWIIAGVANLLRSYSLAPSITPLSFSQQFRFRALVANGTLLIRKRFKNIPIKDFQGRWVHGTVIDPGSFADHDTYAYSGYEERPFPTIRERRSVRGASWDISHSRRLVQVMKILLEARPFTGQVYPNALALRLLANQQAYGIYYEEDGVPLFRNFWDGSNGWYRVNYSNRSGFGYAPGGLSSKWIDSGYCTWRNHNVDLREICQKVEALIFDAGHPGRAHYQQGMFVKEQVTTDTSLFDLQNSIPVMNFLAAMGTK